MHEGGEGGIMGEASMGRHQWEGIIDEVSQKRHHGGGTREKESRRRGSIKEG